MSSNSINFGGITGFQGVSNLQNKTKLQDISNQNNIMSFTQNPLGDSFKLSNTSSLSQIAAQRSEQVTINKEEALNNNSVIGKLWHGFKNLTGIGASSNKITKAQEEEKELIQQLDTEKKAEAFEKLTGVEYSEENLEKFKAGQIQLKSEKALNSYTEGQKMVTDIVGDIASGMTAMFVYTSAVALAPLTGGMTLAFGIGAAALSGAVVKSGVKFLDAKLGGTEYNTFGRDLATGAFSGVLAPITAGIGGAVGKATAKGLGLQAVKQVGQNVVEEGVETGVKQVIKSILMNPTGYEYVGGTALKTAIAYGTDFAVNGAITGGADCAFRTAYDGGSLEDVEKAAVQGAVGGMILSPIIGGSIKYIGHKIGGAQNNVIDNYNAAKEAVENVPTIENPDAEVAKQFANIFKEVDELIKTTKVNGSDIIDDISGHCQGLSDDLARILESSSEINKCLSEIPTENAEVIAKLLTDVKLGKDVTTQLNKLTGGIEAGSEKINRIIAQLSEINAKVNPKIQDGAELAHTVLDSATEIANEAIEVAKKVPDTKAFKMLGDLPERLKSSYETISVEGQAIEKAKEAAQELIRSGKIEEGITALAKVAEDTRVFNAKVEEIITSMQSSAARAGLQESSEILKSRIRTLIASPEFQAMSREQQIEALTENSNILLAKFAQTFSTDKTLPKELTDVLKGFTSNCTVSRTLEEAQLLADELYGAGKYTIQKSYGAGTIGETYLATNPEGKNVVIKMLKGNVTPERFAQDRAMFTKYIEEFVSDAAEKEYKTNLVNSMFDAWDRELDFALEAQGAKQLAEGSKRFSVAQTLEIGTDKATGRNISLVMEEAQGVQLDKLLRMVKTYQENPEKYFTEFAKDIEKHPALKNPETWIDKLGETYQKAQNEQTLFVSKSGTRTIHADPHAGNVFVDFDATNAPKIVFIDAGNVVTKTNSETIQNLGLTMDMMFGHSEGVAKSMLEGATLPSGSSKEEIVKEFSRLLDERLFKAGINLQNKQTSFSIMQDIMKELNVIPNSGNSNVMKATLQRIETSNAINNLCGCKNATAINLKDLATGLYRAFRSNPKEAWATFKPIIQWAISNKDQAMVNFFQMIIKKAETTTV